MGKRDTLCWSCANACGRCSWSKKFEPVEGWEAQKTTFKYGRTWVRANGKRITKSHTGETFIVIACPLFKPDEPKGRQAEYDLL